MDKFRLFLIACSIKTLFTIYCFFVPYDPFLPPCCSFAKISLCSRCFSIFVARMPVSVFHVVFKHVIGRKFFALLVSRFLGSRVVLPVTSWAERDTAVNLYIVDVATTPFSATRRSDAIHCNIVSGTVRHGTGLQ